MDREYGHDEWRWIDRKEPKTLRPFPDSEFAARLDRVRKLIEDRGLGGLLISSAENIFYLTGLNYQGYFAYQLLVIPLEGMPALITRAMEWAIIRDKVPDVGMAASRVTYPSVSKSNN